MYPFVRMAKEMRRAERMNPIALGDTHVSYHICWPQDLDIWLELNNGRSLTLMDLGRIPMAARTGIVSVAKAHGWGFAVAGAVTRYRRRVRLFQRIRMHSRYVGWDARFFYCEQAMYRRDGECAHHGLFRIAVTSKAGIVPTAEVTAAAGFDGVSPPLPGWVAGWSQAESERPWPPEI